MTELKNRKYFGGFSFPMEEAGAIKIANEANILQVQRATILNLTNQLKTCKAHNKLLRRNLSIAVIFLCSILAIAVAALIFSMY